MTKNGKKILKIYLLGIAFLFSACSSNIDYRIGLFLHQITGQIFLEAQSSPQDCFILVIASQNIGIALEQEYLYREQAYIVRPTQLGKYQFTTTNKGQKFQFSFFCPRFQMQTIQFLQTIGLSRITYNPTLAKDKEWKHSYSFIVRPLLDNILVEQQYLLRKSDQLFLSSWLEKIESSF